MSAFHPLQTFDQSNATIVAAKRSTGMQRHRKLETSEQREQRLVRESQIKKAEQAANEAALDRMISRNIEQHGP
jgi:hypothetical protein